MDTTAVRIGEKGVSMIYVPNTAVRQLCQERYHSGEFVGFLLGVITVLMLVYLASKFSKLNK